MEAATWAIVGLTLALILVTGFYAFQTRTLAKDTARMADIAEREAKERREVETTMGTRVAIALSAEVDEMRDLLRGLEDHWDLAATMRRNLVRLTQIPRAYRVFDGLLGQLAVLGPETVRAVVGAYALSASVRSAAESLLSVPDMDIPGMDILRIKEDVLLLSGRLNTAEVLLRQKLEVPYFMRRAT